MRSNVVIPVIVAGLILVGAWVFLHPKGNPANALRSTSAEPPGENRAVTTGARGPEGNANPSGAVAEKTPAGTNAEAAAETTHEAYVAARVAELGELAMEDDAASLETILSELTNRD